MMVFYELVGDVICVLGYVLLLLLKPYPHLSDYCAARVWCADMMKYKLSQGCV